MADKAEWKEGQYGLMYLDLPGGFRATVIWGDSGLQPKGSPEREREHGYKVKFEHSELLHLVPDIPTAKRRAEELARKKLSAALAALPEPGEKKSTVRFPEGE